MEIEGNPEDFVISRDTLLPIPMVLPHPPAALNADGTILGHDDKDHIPTMVKWWALWSFGPQECYGADPRRLTLIWGGLTLASGN